VTTIAISNVCRKTIQVVRDVRTSTKLASADAEPNDSRSAWTIGNR
jgi:hypothetical protein